MSESQTPLPPHGPNACDVFICHASEDKADVVEPLARALQERQLSVWYDRWVLTIGDSLREKIDEGLRSCRFGVVIISQAFFNKQWPQREIEGLVQGELGGRKVILPIWHDVTVEDVRRYSPMLAGRLAGSTAIGIQGLADALVRAMRGDIATASDPPPALMRPPAIPPSAPLLILIEEIDERGPNRDLYVYNAGEGTALNVVRTVLGTAPLTSHTPCNQPLPIIGGVRAGTKEYALVATLPGSSLVPMLDEPGFHARVEYDDLHGNHYESVYKDRAQQPPKLIECRITPASKAGRI